MDDQSLYGLLLVCYVIAYAIWFAAREQKLEVLKQFYPGRADEKALERKEYAVSVMWIGGLLLLLAGWRLRWHPIAAVLLAGLVWVLGVLLRRVLHVGNVLQTRRVRAAVAISVVWWALVAGWYAIFGRRYDFEPSEALLLALVPIPIGILAGAAVKWVKSAQR